MMKYASLEMKQGKTSSADAHGLQVSHRVCAGAHPGVQAEQVMLALLLPAGQTHKYWLNFILLVRSCYVYLRNWIWMKITAGLMLMSGVGCRGSSGAGLFVRWSPEKTPGPQVRGCSLLHSKRDKNGFIFCAEADLCNSVFYTYGPAPSSGLARTTQKDTRTWVVCTSDPVHRRLPKLLQSCKAEQLHETSGTRRMKHYSSLFAV